LAVFVRPRRPPAGPEGNAFPSSREAYAALDLGTNNCRLLIARPAKGGFRVIDSFSRIVRLGEGLKADGLLGEAAIGRTIEALQVCARKIERRQVTRLRAVATEACRRADNCAVLLDRAEREAGIRLEIISNDEEARLALVGCAPLLEQKVSQALIFDIGGGSTEISWLDLSRPRRGHNVRDWAEQALKAWHSLPFGVVSLAEEFAGDGRDGATYAAMVEKTEAALAPFAATTALREPVAAGQVQMLGTSGTVTTLASLHLGLQRYNRARVDGCYLDFDVVHRISRRILAMPSTARASYPCIGRDRSDLVVPGCAILEALCRTWPVGRLRVADRGLREGILHALMQQHRGQQAASRPCRPGPPGRRRRGAERQKFTGPG
jgi:exopolyphosphatase/guanosine-5'-triphosphate,3'-diphosphate pyrophosphatase